jgi:hypothetical protein
MSEIKPQKRSERTSPVLEPLAVTVPDAGKLSGLGKSMINELIAKQRLASVKVGNRRLVLLRSLKALLEAA